MLCPQRLWHRNTNIWLHRILGFKHPLCQAYFSLNLLVASKKVKHSR